MRKQKVYQLSKAFNYFQKKKDIFMQGFREGFLRTNKYVIPITIALAAGHALGSYSHPYESCKRMYETPEDISECVWIKENP